MYPFQSIEGKKHEDSFVEALILKEKRSRYKELLSRPLRRQKVLSRFRGPDDINIEKFSYLPADLPDSHIAKFMKELGAPEVCYAFSEDEFPKGKFGRISELVDNIVFGGGGVISCIPGQLVFVVGEYGQNKLFFNKH